ncbi:MAG: FeoB small GTPase domain-containing protein, partial [Candidatus Hinthialibacter sp.]
MSARYLRIHSTDPSQKNGSIPRIEKNKLQDSRDSITIALAGNPNSGKTTLFNQMTGRRQHVGNYPGVTVEKKDGVCLHKGKTIHVVDLPGAYSLTARSPEELAARDFLFEERPDVIVDIVDASNIERNLYLYTQLLELNIPLVIALNMSDMAKSRGIEFDLENLSQLLGAPIVPTVAHKGRGIEDLLDAAVSIAARKKEYMSTPIHFGRDIE